VPDPEEAEVLDPNKGKAALELIAARIYAYRPSELLFRRGTNVYLAAVKLVQIGQWLREGPIKAPFLRLDPLDFDIEWVELVEPAARAVGYVQSQLELAQTTVNKVKLPPALVTEGYTVRERMLKVVSYYFEDDPELGPQVAFITSGKGYLDLHNDLVQLATLYHDYDDTIKDDKKHYRPTDEADAFRLAAAMEEQFEAQTHLQFKALQDQLLRAWTLLNEAWDEVCASGRFLYRKRPEECARFQSSAHALGRRSAKSAPATAPITPPTP
jgi:hypothetical protein